MGVRVKEITRLSLSAPKYEGRKVNRIYEDQAWSYAMRTGQSPWPDPENPPEGESDFRP